jgi:hypothetical protein
MAWDTVLEEEGRPPGQPCQEIPYGPGGYAEQLGTKGPRDSGK